MLEVHDLNTFYGQYQALYDVSLTVGDGEFVIVLGPNGHGKTTLLRSICGLVSPRSGTITFNGENIAGRSCPQIVNKGLVYVAENRHLFPEMTVKENLLLGAYNRRARKAKAQNLEFVFVLFPALKALKDRAAGALSGGEARMVAIGRGLMSDAQFIALDEPSVGLAPILVTEVFAKAREINAAGKTILLVEQNLSEVIEYASRVYVMEEGRIVLEGSHEDVLANPEVKRIFLGL
jgi:branched-chain amino acid transport system ATP-binding protein